MWHVRRKLLCGQIVSCTRSAPQAWLVATVLLGGVTLLFVRQKTRPELVMLGMLTIFMATGIITPQQGLKGFSNSGLATVAVLFIIATAISTAGVDDLVSLLLGRPRDIPTAILRLTLPVVALSSFVNDTPIVVIMLPVVTAWCRRCDLAPAALLMPLSYAALLGGTVTLVGTSANLVVAGQYRRRYLDPESPSFDPAATQLPMFGVTRFGLPAALWGIAFIVVAVTARFGRASSVNADDAEDVDDFLIGLQVLPHSPCVGRSVEGAGLRGLPGLFLVCVRRCGETFHAVGPEFVLAAGDVLYFTGVLDEHVADLAQQHALQPFTHELELEQEDNCLFQQQHNQQRPQTMTRPAAAAAPRLADTTTRHHVGVEEQQPPQSPSSLDDHSTPRLTPRRSRTSLLGDRSAFAPPVTSAGPPKLVRATIRATSPIVGATIKAVGFRLRYNASIVAVQRGGKNLVGVRLGEVTLAGGDVLLMDVGPHFWALGRDGTETFDHITPLSSSVPNASSTAASNSEADLLGREFMLPMEVVSASLAGQTVEQAGLRGLPDGFLVSIEREGTMLHAVAPTETLHLGDILWFACRADSVVSIRRVPGLAPHRSTQVDKLQTRERRLVQAVVASHSPLAGQLVRALRFRTRFDAAIVAVHRQGVRVKAKIGDIVLQPGDVLLLDTGAHFLTEHRNGPLFALISEIENSSPPRGDRALVLATTGMAFALTALGAGELVVMLMLAVGVLVTAGSISREQALGAVRWDVVLMIGAAFGAAEAVRESGLADALCGALLWVVGTTNTAGVVAVIYLVTAALCQAVANNAAVALVYPIAGAMGDAAGIDPQVMACVVMLAGSATYASPFAYATNLMVFAAGRYSTADFAVVGGALQLWQAVVTVVAVVVPGAWVWLTGGGVCAIMLGFVLAVLCGKGGGDGRARRKDPSSLHQGLMAA